MDAKYNFVSVILLALLLVQKTSASSMDYLATLFGTTNEDDDTVLYVAIAFLLLTITLFIVMVICLHLLYKLMKEKIRKRQEQLELEEKRRWRGHVDDIIDDAHRMVPLPRAYSTSGKGYTNGSYANAGIEFVNSRI